jgi:hypothetical protein
MDIAALRLRFDANPDGFRITKADVEEWRSKTNMSFVALRDEIAWTLAVSFDREEHSFEFCDCIINLMHGIAVQHYPAEADNVHVGLFWEVFLAFDSGEFHARQNDNPVEEYTKPLIRKVIARGRGGLQSL